MARQIIKQPNGKYCIFAHIIDNVIIYDATKKEIIDFLIEESKVEITMQVNYEIGQLENRSLPHAPFNLSYEDMKERIKDVHGIESVFDLEKYCETA